MGLWCSGQHRQTVRREIGDGKVGATVAGELVTIRRSEVNDYLDEWFWGAFDVWYRWRMFAAMPFSGGWAEQPAPIVEIIETAEAAYRSNQHAGSR